jgi:hypothetical protein
MYWYRAGYLRCKTMPPRQCWGSGSGSGSRSARIRIHFGRQDPDPHGSAFILVGWIRIRIGNTDPDPGGPNWPTKVKNIQVLKCSWGKKTSPVAGSGSGSALTKNAGSGSTLKPMRIRITAPRFKPKKVLTPESYRLPAPSLDPDPDPLNPDPAFHVNPDPVPDPDSGFWWPKIEGKNTAEENYIFFDQNCNLLISRPP